MKPGWKTSEFALSILSSVLALLNQSGLLGQPLPVDTILSIASPVIAYVLSRTVVKATNK